MSFIKNMKALSYHAEVVDSQCAFNDFNEINIDAADEI